MTDFDQLFADARSLRGLAVSLVSSSGADDLVQDTLIVASAEGKSEKPWLRGVMKNLARMRHREGARRHARELAADLDREQATPDEQLHRMRVQRLLCDAVLELPESYREVIVLHHFDGLSLAAIAKRERVPEGTIRWRHKEALDKLRAALDRKSNGDRKAWVAALAPLARIAAPAPAVGAALVVVIVLACAALAAAVLGLATRSSSPAQTATGSAAPQPPITSAAPAPALATPAQPSRDQIAIGAGRLPPTPPPHYELTIVTASSVAVDLAGGKSGVFVPDYAPKPAPKPERAITGRVVGANAAGAIVLAGTRIDLHWGQLMAEAGATANADGRFRIDHAPDGDIAMIAVTPTGWSPVIAVTGARDGIELAIPASGKVSGKVTYGGSPTDATLSLSPAGFPLVTLGFDSAPDGTFAFPLLAPGSYDLAAWPTRGIAGGASKREHAQIAIAPGADTHHDFALGSGTLLVVHGVAPAGKTADIVDVFLVAGHRMFTSVADIKQVPADQRDELLHGGIDAPAPIQFHDRTPGEYTACVELRFTDTDARAFGCATADLAADPNVRELDIPTTMR